MKEDNTNVEGRRIHPYRMSLSERFKGLFSQMMDGIEPVNELFAIDLHQFKVGTVEIYSIFCFLSKYIYSVHR